METNIWLSMQANYVIQHCVHKLRKGLRIRCVRPRSDWLRVAAKLALSYTDTRGRTEVIALHPTRCANTDGNGKNQIILFQAADSHSS
jgi:hypothetical protein